MAARSRRPRAVDWALPGLGALAGRVDRLVLEQQHDVARRARDDRGMNLTLQGPGSVVLDLTEPSDVHEGRVTGR